MGKAFSVCFDGFRRWGSTPRIYVIFILALFMVHQWVRIPIVSFVKDVHVAVTPWYYPFLMENWYISMMIQIGAVLLFCDAPFFNSGTPYLFIRAGRRWWFIGQVLYVILAALAYQLFLALSCCFIMIPYLEFSSGWGKVFYTLAQSNAADTYGMTYIRYATLVYYTPLQAVAIQLSLSWMVTVIFGMVILTINLCLPRICGPICGLVLSMLPSLAINFSGPMLYWFSPGSWMTLSTIGKPGITAYPPLSYTLPVGLSIIILLMLLSQRRFRTLSIEVLSPIS